MKHVPPKSTNGIRIAPASPKGWPQHGTGATDDNTHQSQGIVQDIEPGCRRNAKCQDVRHATQEGDRSEVSFGAVEGIMGTRVECWASGQHGGREFGEEGVEDDFQASSPEKGPARVWRLWR